MTKEQRTRVLIIDDEPLIALGIQDLLLEAEFEIAGVAGKLVDAIALIELGAFEAAILDANLAGVSASSAGSLLTERGLPYVVLSGYSGSQLAGVFPGAAVILQKPCDPSLLISAVNAMMPRPH